MNPYSILIPVILALKCVHGWHVPYQANDLAESRYPFAFVDTREHLRQALNELPFDGFDELSDPQAEFMNRRSTISKNQLDRIVKAMRTRMFGPV